MTDLLAESLEALERAGCQYDFCDGPTLEPIDCKTCFVCELVARLRVELGQPPRRDDELTFVERDDLRHRQYIARATGR